MYVIVWKGGNQHVLLPVWEIGQTWSYISDDYACPWQYMYAYDNYEYKCLGDVREVQVIYVWYSKGS